MRTGDRPAGGGRPSSGEERMTVFGVQTWIGPNPNFWAGAINQLGCTETRIDFRWRDIEPAQGQYDWTSPDQYVTNCLRGPLYPTPVLYLPPAWADPNGRGVPSDLTAWGQFCYFCAERYGPGGTFWQENPSLPEYPITLYEIGNEPNFWNPGVWTGYPEEYVTVFNVAASWIRAKGAETGNQLDVIIGGLGYVEPGSEPYGWWNPFNFLDVVQQNGITIPDAVGFHPYGFNAGGSVTNAYGNTNTRIKSVGSHMVQMGWESVGLDITEDGLYARIDNDFNISESDRYTYFHDTVINIKYTYQTSAPAIRRYSAYAYFGSGPWDIIDGNPGPYQYNWLPTAYGYHDGING
jgi:hypothetical protein